LVKLECGICRLPFNKEYIKNDPVAMELLNENSEQRSNDIILTISNNRNIRNNNIDTNNIANSLQTESETNSDIQPSAQHRFNNPNEEIINREPQFRINGPAFIIKYHPNKLISSIVLILNIIPGGLGTMLLGISRKSVKYIIAGIFQFIFISAFIVLGILTLMRKFLFTIKYNKLLPISLIILSIYFYLISIYIGIINNFVFINSKRYKKFHAKEVGIFILISNIIIPGFGTLMIQSIIPDKCLIKMKRTFNGLAQLGLFIVLYLYFSGLSKMNDNLLLFIFLAIVEYLYVIGTSICFLRNIAITDDIYNEIEINY
jgi:hypothetical protein